VDAARLQTLIYRGYAKEAKIAGEDYDVYRAVSPMNPITDSNKVTTLKAWFIADDKASVTNKYQTPTWFLRADGSQLEVFDFLVGPFGTFYVASKAPQLPMEAVRCNNTVSIGRIDYSVIPLVATPYAAGLPIFKQYRREDIRRDATGNEVGNAITHWRSFIPLPKPVIANGDIVTDDDGNSYTIDAPDFTSSGYAANMRLTTI